MKNLARGFYSGIPAKEYREIDALNVSSIKKMGKSPMHLDWAMKHPDPQTADMEIGTALHAAVLEPDTFFDVVAMAPDCPKRSNAEKELWETFRREAKGKILLKQGDIDTIHSMVAAIRRHPEASMLLDLPGLTELTCIWMDPRGFFCKSRPDKVTADEGILLDLKSCDDASPDGFARNCAKFKYHWQAAWYLRGMSVVSEFHHTDFRLIAVEKLPPYGVAVYQMPQIYVNTAMDQMDPLLSEYGRCRADNRWPGYSEKTQLLQMPMWALRQPGEV